MINRNKHLCSKEWRTMASGIALLYAISLVAYAVLLSPDAEMLTTAALASMIITLAAAIVMWCARCPGMTTTSEKFQTNERALQIFWLISMISVLISITDLAHSVFLTAHIRDEITLGTIRDDFFNTEGFRSEIGKVTGQLFIPFALASAVLFRVNGNVKQLLLSFIISAVYSLLMGGRGQIIFFSLISLPNLLSRLSLSKVIFLASALVALLGFIYNIRTPDDGGSLFHSIGQYISTPWWGFNLLVLDPDFTPSIDLIRGGAPFILEKFAFPIFGSYGNLFGGSGQLLYSFGWLGAPLYFSAIVLMFCLLGRLVRSAPIARAGLQSLAFLYFTFFLFHDLTIFYSSYDLAVFLVTLVAISRLYSQKKPLHIAW